MKSKKILNALLAEFLGHMSNKNRSTGTIDGYRLDIEGLIKFVMMKKGITKETNMRKINAAECPERVIKKLAYKDLEAYITYCKDVKGNGASALCRKISSMKEFFSYLKKIKAIKNNPAEDLEMPKKEKRKRIHMDKDQAQKVVVASTKTRNPERDHAIATILLHCGLRVSELIHIKLENIKEHRTEDGNVAYTLSVIGKGNKEREIPFDYDCVKAVCEYATVRNKNKKADDSNNYLFLSERGNMLSKCSAEVVVKRMVKLAGLDDTKLSAHKFRHTFATLLYKNDVDIRTIQVLLGHSSVATTQIYTHVDDEQLVNAIAKNPLSSAC